jgi:hypothetical protein
VTPTPEDERLAVLDVLRGVALFGVLWVNLLTEFRISLFEHLFTFHTHSGRMNEWIDLVTAWLVEFKAFTVFSFLFGVGIGIQTERVTSRGTGAPGFLLRRFAILFVIGILHMFLIWNGDILCLYAICGWLVIPVLRLPTWLLIGLGLTTITISFAPCFGAFVPSEQIMRAHAAASTPIYATGSFTDILALRWKETWSFMIPLLLNALPKTCGLMLLGVACGDPKTTCKAPIIFRDYLCRRDLCRRICNLAHFLVCHHEKSTTRGSANRGSTLLCAPRSLPRLWVGSLAQLSAQGRRHRSVRRCRSNGSDQLLNPIYRFRPHLLWLRVAVLRKALPRTDSDHWRYRVHRPTPHQWGMAPLFLFRAGRVVLEINGLWELAENEEGGMKILHCRITPNHDAAAQTNDYE